VTDECALAQVHAGAESQRLHEVKEGGAVGEHAIAIVRLQVCLRGFPQSCRDQEGWRMGKIPQFS